MATSISSVDASLLNLAPTFQKTIKSIIESESEPLKRTQTLKDQLDVRRGVYNDIKTNFEALQTALQALISTQASYGMKPVSKATITPALSGTTVLSATLSSESAPVSEYDFSVIRLAKAESRVTDAFSSSDIALNKSGAFWLGGIGAAELQTETAPGVYSAFIPGNTLIGATTSAVAEDQRELGEGNYTVQVRDEAGVRQFRLVDMDGQAVSIRSADGSSAYTANWQKVVDGGYDTGRGQSLILSSLGSLNSTSFHYKAKGTSITINPTDTLRTIANAINAAIQPTGHDLKASIVANQLVLSAAQTGTNHAMIFTDRAGLGLNTLLQPAENAQFRINGMDVSSARNNELTNIVDGVTISLAADAEGKCARLSVGSNADKAMGLLNTFVNKFNTAVTHLKDKLAATAKTEGNKTTYTRGPLTGDTTFSSLRTDVYYRMNRLTSNTGSYKHLEEIGLSFDKDMKLVFDSAKFGEAMKNRASDVTALLDATLTGLNDLISRYTGSKGYLTRTLASVDSQRQTVDQRIEKYNNTLSMRKQALYKQYLDYQNQLAELGRTAEMFGINIGSNVDTSQ